MLKKYSIVQYLICLFFVTFFNGLSGVVLEYENQPIREIKILIHEKLAELPAEDAILNSLKTRQGVNFSQTDFDEDLKILSKNFDRIEPSIDVVEGELSLRIDIWPKPMIASICFDGNKAISTQNLLNELNIKCSTVFDRQEFNTAFHKLKAYYISNGYFEAEIDYDVQMNFETNEVNISIVVKEGRSGKIQEIKFLNFTDHEKKSILNHMITKKYNLFTSWYTNGGIYNKDAVEQDRLVMTNYLQNQGFADADVKIDVEESCKTNRIIVIVTAYKGEYYRFGSLSFEGNTILENSAIDRLFTIRSGEPFSMENLHKTVEAITDAYGRFGYVDAVVDFDRELVDGRYGYNVNFKINEGEQFRVGLIRVFGNVTTKTPVILHETLLVPGEIFNSVKLKATEKRLINMGYFKNVNAYIVKGTESSLLGGSYRDVYIEVEETTTGSGKASVGVSSVEQIFGEISITERNFNHEGFYYFWRDGLRAFRGRGEYAQFSIQIGQKNREYLFSWTKPFFRDSKWTIGCDLSKTSTRYVSKEYDLDTVSLALRASYDINQFLRFGVQYRLTNGHINLHHSGKRNKKLKKEAKESGLISAIGPSLSYDSTNHPLKPTSGFRSRLSGEYAGIGGDHQFFNVAYLNSYFFPVGSRLVFKYQADFRFLQPLGSTQYKTVPLEERIFLGGEYMIRGFRPYRLGPTYSGSKDNKDTPRGGLSLQFYSVQATRRITEDFEVFAFIDAGHLSVNTWEFGRMSVAVGYGATFKVISSVPPVTIGMGYPLNAHNRSDVRKFFFSFGGNF